MRKHLYRILPLLMSVSVLAQTGLVAAYGAEENVDTIVLETDVAEEEIPVDLSWKTQQDKGQWIEEMGIAGESTSLVLILNNQEEEDEDYIPPSENMAGKTRSKIKKEPGNSRLIYLSKDSNGEWQELISVNCSLSGGKENTIEDTYGVYRLESSFGILSDPGSLVPFYDLDENDFWYTDVGNENFGSIVSVPVNEQKGIEAVNFLRMRSYSNYGMILKPEDGNGYPALLVNCQQSKSTDNTFCGIQLDQTYVRMLIQSIDENTRILIQSELADMEGM